MENMSVAKIILVENLKENGKLGDKNWNGEDNVKMDPEEIRSEDVVWIQLRSYFGILGCDTV
jgi:hypothetical protein